MGLSGFLSFARKSSNSELATRLADRLQLPHPLERSPAARNATASCSAGASSGRMLPGSFSQGWALKSSYTSPKAAFASIVFNGGSPALVGLVGASNHSGAVSPRQFKGGEA